MAESKLSARLEEVVTCAVCLLKPSVPKLLQCQHTFCLKCIQAVYDKAIASNPTVTEHVTCPLCTTKMSVPDGGLSQLANDLRANEIISILNDLDVENDPRKKCFVCKKSDTEVLCFDCAKPYCKSCFVKHDSNRRFAEHVYSPVKARDISKLICKEHDDFVQIFCLDCVKAVCGACTMTGHNEHDLQEFSRSRDIESGLISSDPATFLRATAFKITKKINKIPGLINVNREHNESIKASVRKHKLELFKSICKTEGEIISRVDKEQMEYEQKMSAINTQLLTAKQNLGTMEQQNNAIKTPMMEAPTITMLNKEGLVEKITESVSEISDVTDKPLAMGVGLSFNPGCIEVNFGSLGGVLGVQQSLDICLQ